MLAPSPSLYAPLHYVVLWLVLNRALKTLSSPFDAPKRIGLVWPARTFKRGKLAVICSNGDRLSIKCSLPTFFFRGVPRNGRETAQKSARLFNGRIETGARATGLLCFSD